MTCIDYWIYVDPVTMTARHSVQGWSGPDETVDLTGDGRVDGRRLASDMRARSARLPADGLQELWGVHLLTEPGCVVLLADGASPAG